MKTNNFDPSEIEVSIPAEQIKAAMTKEQFDKIDKKELKRDTKKEKVEHEKDAIKDDKSKIKKLEKGKPSEKKDAEKKALKRDMKFDKKSKEKMEGDAIRGYPRKPVMAEMVKDGEYKGKPPKTKMEGDAIRGYPRRPMMAEMTDKQKSGLDKNKDGKITKEDFEMLRKGKKKSDGKNGKKIKPKTSYAQLLIDIAAERFGKKKEVN